jgi:hypothetical protein
MHNDLHDDAVFPCRSELKSSCKKRTPAAAWNPNNQYMVLRITAHGLAVMKPIATAGYAVRPMAI